MDKRAQGLSLSFIVVAAIAALVLVIVIAFTMGGLGGFFKKMTGVSEEAAEGTDVATAQSTCATLCMQAQGITSPARWKTTTYCTREFLIDSERYHCWEAPIRKTCTYSMTDAFGATASCDATNCLANTAGPDGCPKIECSTEGTTITCNETISEVTCLACDTGATWNATLTPKCNSTDTYTCSDVTYNKCATDVLCSGSWRQL